MARIDIDGLGVEYELMGPEGAQAVAITPGGRFSKETAGVRELGQALAAGGRRVLIWDRPNCGASDISFDAVSEAALQAHALTQTIRRLNLGPTALAAGSGGSRLSLIAASRDPEAVSHLIVWWISGGVVGLVSLANHYCGEYAIAASMGGMEAVAAMPGWEEQMKMNPKAREQILRYDPKAFIKIMERWSSFYLPSDETPVPGMTPETFAGLEMPVLIFRNGESDMFHNRATSDWVAKLTPQARYEDPPWEDAEWNYRMLSVLPDGRKGLFSNWPALAPRILAFTA
jgi:pimeloyl-ACP methyl ester carboxylesterase